MEENDHAWRVNIIDVAQKDDQGNVIAVNLDLKNPSFEDDYEHMPPRKLVQDIIEKESQILELMQEILGTLK